MGVGYCILAYAIGVLIDENWIVSALLKGPVEFLEMDMTGILLGGAALVICGMCFCGSAVAPRPVAIALILLGVLAWHLTGLLYLYAMSSV